MDGFGSRRSVRELRLCASERRVATGAQDEGRQIRVQATIYVWARWRGVDGCGASAKERMGVAAKAAPRVWQVEGEEETASW